MRNCGVRVVHKRQVPGGVPDKNTQVPGGVPLRYSTLIVLWTASHPLSAGSGLTFFYEMELKN